MSLQVFVGPSKTGKTFRLREHLIPTLLTRPTLVTEMAPSGGYSAVLIHDPPTVDHPGGQYPGQRFRDVADWLRAPTKPRVACLESPTFEAMCEVGQQLGGLVLVIDELERALAKGGRSSAVVMEMLIAARQHGCIVIGGAKRLKAVPTDARSNLEAVYFGNLSDAGDRADAADMARVPVRVLDELAVEGGPLTQQGTFLECRLQSGWRGLTRIQNRQKITITQL